MFKILPCLFQDIDMDMDTDKHIDIDTDNLSTQRFKEIKKKLSSVDRILEN
jgi:hypothetical protein